MLRFIGAPQTLGILQIFYDLIKILHFNNYGKEKSVPEIFLSISFYVGAVTRVDYQFFLATPIQI
jgi:hypothetical protein